MPHDDDILDPAHQDDGGIAPIAGIPDPEPKDKVSEDGNILERDGHKYVRAEALHQEREEKQKLSNTIKSLEPLMPEFEAFLAQKRDRNATTVQRTRPETMDDYSEDELTGLAITRGYYDADGQTPDLKRAKSELDILTRVSTRAAGRAVRPLAEQTAKDRSATNRANATANKFVDGEPIASDKYMKAAFDALPEEYSADPMISNITQVIAAGLEYLDHRKNGTLRRGRGGREPMMVERGTGRYDGDTGNLSDLDLAAARARGKSPDEWAKMSKAVAGTNRGSSILEDA